MTILSRYTDREISRKTQDTASTLNSSGSASALWSLSVFSSAKGLTARKQPFFTVSCSLKWPLVCWSRTETSACPSFSWQIWPRYLSLCKWIWWRVGRRERKAVLTLSTTRKRWMIMRSYLMPSTKNSRMRCSALMPTRRRRSFSSRTWQPMDGSTSTSKTWTSSFRSSTLSCWRQACSTSRRCQWHRAPPMLRTWAWVSTTRSTPHSARRQTGRMPQTTKEMWPLTEEPDQ